MVCNPLYNSSPLRTLGSVAGMRGYRLTVMSMRFLDLESSDFVDAESPRFLDGKSTEFLYWC